MDREKIPGGGHPHELRLFVYGTLKRGGRHHARLCAGAHAVEPATVWGRLYHLPAGFPALVFPRSRVLAHGSADPVADARRQSDCGHLAGSRPIGDWDRVQGEILSFADPAAVLPPIDTLEAYRPGGHSLFQRVLVTARAGSTDCPVWLYCATRTLRGRRIVTGTWVPEGRTRRAPGR